MLFFLIICHTFWSLEYTRLDLILYADDIDVEYTEAEAQQLQHPAVEVSKGKKFADRFTGALKSLKGIDHIITLCECYCDCLE
jgi:hypothetical protein